MAQSLVKTLPLMGRAVGAHMRERGEDEGTLIQILALKQFSDKSFTTSELAKRRKVSLQSASALVQRLVERGWIERTPDPDDRRQVRLELTPEGLAHAQATFDQIVSRLADFLEPLTPEELEAGQVFMAALQRLAEISPEEVLER
jgi:DNA-binding MarR family transcriptional regulator